MRPDFVAVQDTTTQMAVNQFMASARPSVAVLSTIHCYHLINVESTAEANMKHSKDTNKEIYELFSSAAKKFGFRFWNPGIDLRGDCSVRGRTEY